MKKVTEYLNVLSKYCRARQDVSDEIQAGIYIVRDEIQTSIETDISRKEVFFG